MRTRNSVKTGFAACFVVALFAAFVAPASADFVVADFGALPTSTNTAEFIWTGDELYIGAGAKGTNFNSPGSGDGDLPMSQQNSPGLVVQSSVLVPGSIPGMVTTVDDTSLFYDSTLLLLSGTRFSGLAKNGNATVVGGLVVQPLMGAGFEIWSTDPFDGIEDNSTLLLKGTITDATLIGLSGSKSGSVLSATVSYTDGAILDAFGGGSLTGEFSWSLSLITGKFSVSGGNLAPFEANATGQFTAVPEPGAFALLGIGALGLVGYAVRRRKAC